MSGPVTNAGQRLVKWARDHQVPWDVTSETVEEAEREAVALAMADLRARVMGLYPSAFPAVHVSPDASDPASYAIGEGAGMSQMKSRVLALVDDATKGDGA